MPIVQAVTCYSGESVKLQDEILLVSGADEDITGWTVECVIHAKLGDTVPIKRYANDGTGGVTVTTPNVTVSIPVADVQAMLAYGQALRFYIRRIDAGAESVLTLGPFNINLV